jgi:ABC-type bacteriocin/lantibiotic exporter with double-glycine peptidase domain
MRISIDQAKIRRCVVRESLPEAAPGDATAELYEVLAKCAPAARMRVDLVTPPLNAAALVRPSAPLGRFWISESGRLEWLLLTECRGGKVRTFDSTTAGYSWQPRKRFAQRSDDGETTKEVWIALQPMFSCEASDAHDDEQPSPWSRYLSLVRPDRSDIGVILVFALLVGVLALATPIAVESLVNTVAFGQFLQPVIVLAVLLFVFLAFAAAMRGLQVYVAEIILRRIFVRVACDLAARLPRVRHEFWMSHYGPELINRFFEVTAVQKVTTQLLLDGTALVLQALVGMAVIAFYHPVLLGFDIVLVLLILAVVFILGRGAVATSIDESRQKYATAAWLEELARHPLAFRSTGGMSFALDHGDRLVTSYLFARSSHFRILIRQMTASLALQVLASTVLLGLGGWLVIRGELTLGQLVAAELIVTVIVGSFAKIAKYLESYYDVLASVDKLGHLLDMPMERAEGVELPRKTSGIELAIHDLTTEKLASGQQIHGANLRISAGERVAVVGPNSGLRRALVETIGGIRPPVSGHVELDELDSRRLRPDSVYDQVAVIAEPEVFEGTIAENIHLGRTDVGENDIRSALECVVLLDEVLDLPQGLSTIVHTDGKQFSGEQLVRLMLARAMAAKPRLLLIDGALDRLPDDQIDDVIRSVMRVLPGCTILIATGRQAVAAACHRQVWIDAGGQIIETVTGRHKVGSGSLRTVE